MKGLISGIKRMEIHDGDGLRTTVFFKGCPLKCVWCHNPESILFNTQVAKIDDKCIGCGLCKGQKNENTAKNCPVNAQILYGESFEVEDLVNLLKKDEAFYFNSGGGVTLSGGECLAQPDFAIKLAKRLKENGISVYVDTCGYVKWEIFEKIAPYTDVFLYDIKAIDSEVHKKCTGKDNALILDNIKKLNDLGCKIYVRYPLVKGYNDFECEKIGKFLSSLNCVKEVKVLKYHNYAGSRYASLGMENTLPDVETTYLDVQNAVNTLKKYSLTAKNGIDEN